MEEMCVNKRAYQVIKLLGHGKGIPTLSPTEPRNMCSSRFTMSPATIISSGIKSSQK